MKWIKKYVDKTFGKFIIVGIVNTLFGTGVMFFSYNCLHFSYWVSSALNYILGSILSYILNKNFTFQSKASSKKTLLPFAINIAVCYGVAYGVARPLIRLCLSGAGQVVQDNVAMGLGMCIFVVLNYLGQRLFVFGKSAQEQENREEGR